ncbi:MAG: sulfatase [Gemmataceae bacterium]
MKRFTWSLLALLFIGQCASSAEKPNIVLIFVDDWAWCGTPVRMDDKMPNSAMPILRMPHLEKMARDGMRFRNAYAGAPQCSPSRVCLQTGQTAARSGFTVFMNPRGAGQIFDTSRQYSQYPVVPCTSDATIDPEAVTIAEALKMLGYISAHFGKWHMRGDPGDEGYSEHDGATTNKEGNEQLMDDPKRMFSTTKRAIEFMEKQHKEGKPFFVQISHYAMHAGRECLPKTREKYAKHPVIKKYYKDHGLVGKKLKRKRDPAVWLGMGTDLDTTIGSVLNKLEQLKIRDNTYVIVTSDNGYRHKFFPGLAQPLHGAKWWLWQGGVRVPMIATGPGIKGGSVCRENVVNYDFLPTFVEWAGGDPSKLKNIDGVSLASLMRGKKADEKFRNRFLYFHYPHYRTSMPHSAIVSGKLKVLHFYERPDIPMLFDLKDEREVRNIADKSTKAHNKLYREMMLYLKKVGARIPKRNPDFSLAAYQKAKQYEVIQRWGPFKGERKLEEDEK